MCLLGSQAQSGSLVCTSSSWMVYKGLIQIKLQCTCSQVFSAGASPDACVKQYKPSSGARLGHVSLYWAGRGI